MSDSEFWFAILVVVPIIGVVVGGSCGILAAWLDSRN